MQDVNNGQTLLLEVNAAHLLDHPDVVPTVDSALGGGLWYWSATFPDHGYMSPCFWDALGLEVGDAEAMGAFWLETIFPTDARRSDLSGLHSFDKTVLLERQKGPSVAVRVSGVAVLEKGRPTQLVGQHRAMSQTDMQPDLRDIPPEIEYRHRVRNLFAVAQSITRLSARGTNDLTDYLEQVETRFAALSAAHSAEAANPAEKTTSFNAIIASVLSAFEELTITIDGPAQTVGIADDQVTPWALVLNELARGARHRMMRSDVATNIILSWTLQPTADAPDSVTVEWREPLVDAKLAGKSGSEMLSTVLLESSVEQMRGTKTETRTDDSYIVRIAFARNG